MTSHLPMPFVPCTDAHCSVHGYGLHPVPGTEEAKYTNPELSPRCARQILRAYDRAPAIALLEREAPNMSSGRQFMIPLARASEMVQPGQTVAIEAVPDKNLTDPGMRVLGFQATRFDVSDAMHDGWIINDILFDGRSQLGDHRDIPSAFFSAAFPNLRAFDYVHGESLIRVIATRTGPTPSPFYGLMAGLAHTGRRLSEGQIAELVEAWGRIVEGKGEHHAPIGSPPSDVTATIGGLVQTPAMIVKQMGAFAYAVPSIEITPNPDGSSTERISLMRAGASTGTPKVNIASHPGDEGGDLITIVRQLPKPTVAVTGPTA